MSTRPLVSVIIPAYNGARWIGETIQSVLAQTHRPIEVIVADNGSTDDTCAVAAAQGELVRVVRATTRGPGAARNAGLDAARGEFVQFLDGDDLLEPWKVERQLVALERTGADLVWGPWWSYDQLPGTEEFRRGARRVPRIGGDVALDLLSSDGWLQIGSVLQRQSPRLAALRFLPSEHLEEIDYHIRAALAGAVFARGDGDSGLLFRQHRGPRVSNASEVRIANGTLRNARMLRRWWEERGELTQPRREALADALLYVARTLARVAPERFAPVAAELRALDPHFERRLPARLRAISRVVGYERAERLAGRARRVKSLLRGGSSAQVVDPSLHTAPADVPPRTDPSGAGPGT